MNQPVTKSKREATPYLILGVNLVVLALSIAWLCDRWQGDRAGVGAGASVEGIPTRSSRPTGGG
jgi:hypothetical protein